MLDLQILKPLFKVNDHKSGYSENEIWTREQELGITFPPTLRRYYLELAKDKAIAQAFAWFCPLEELTLNQYGKIVFFMDQNTGYQLSIKPSNLANQEDHQNDDDFHTSFIDQCLASIMTNVVIRSNDRVKYGANCESIGTLDLKIIKQSFKKIGKRNHQEYFQNTPNDLITTIFDADFEKTSLSVISNDKQSFFQIIDKLSADWFYLKVDGDMLIDQWNNPNNS